MMNQNARFSSCLLIVVAVVIVLGGVCVFAGWVAALVIFLVTAMAVWGWAGINSWPRLATGQEVIVHSTKKKSGQSGEAIRIYTAEIVEELLRDVGRDDDARVLRPGDRLVVIDDYEAKGKSLQEDWSGERYVRVSVETGRFAGKVGVVQRKFIRRK